MQNSNKVIVKGLSRTRREPIRYSDFMSTSSKYIWYDEMAEFLVAFLQRDVARFFVELPEEADCVRHVHLALRTEPNHTMHLCDPTATEQNV